MPPQTKATAIATEIAKAKAKSKKTKTKTKTSYEQVLALVVCDNENNLKFFKCIITHPFGQ